MASVLNAICDTVSISQFNCGMAGKICDEVMKNNKAEVVILSPDTYKAFCEEIIDSELLIEAAERMSHFDPDDLISLKEIDKEYGITRETLDSIRDVEIE